MKGQPCRTALTEMRSTRRAVTRMHIEFTIGKATDASNATGERSCGPFKHNVRRSIAPAARSLVAACRGPS